MAQGLPIGIFLFALPAWMAANGATAIAVGSVLSAATLPWSLKFINGFVMDRFAWLPMGRRRPWLIVSQSCIAMGLVAFAVANPNVEQVLILSAFGFASAALAFVKLAASVSSLSMPVCNSVVSECLAK